MHTKDNRFLFSASRCIFVHFRHKFAPFDCSMTNNFLCLLSSPLKEIFRNFVIYCPSRKKRFRAPNLAAILGKCNVFCGGGGIPPKMPRMNTERQWHVGSHRWSTNRLLNVSKVKYEASHNHSGYKYQLTQMDPRDALPASRASCCAQRWTLSVINWPRPSVERRPPLSNEADHTLPRSTCRGEIHMWMCGCCIPLYVCLSPLQIAHSRERHIGRIVTMRMRQWMHRICRRGGSVRCKCGGPSMDRKK